jgi:hypothetical protein
MWIKVALLAAALALASPGFANKPSKPRQATTTVPAPKSVATTTSKTSNLGGGAIGGTANSGIIGEVTMEMQKDAQENQAAARKEAQGARGNTRGGQKVTGNLTVTPPKK